MKRQRSSYDTTAPGAWSVSFLINWLFAALIVVLLLTAAAHILNGGVVFDVFTSERALVEAGKVDDAVRAYYESLGWGPGYAVPGLSHRTGHGIGLDGHEDPYIVAGNTQLLDVGMAFSIEPGIYLPGEFGVRIEDIVVCTADGAERLNRSPRQVAVVG